MPIMVDNENFHFMPSAKLDVYKLVKPNRQVVLETSNVNEMIAAMQAEMDIDLEGFADMLFFVNDKPKLKTFFLIENNKEA